MSTMGALREGRGAISPRTGDLERDARLLLAEELARLEAAELFYVDADMTRLAVAAAETLPVHQFHPTDVPAPAGFCVFAEPIATYLNEGGAYDGLPISIVAVSWGDSPMMALTRDTGLWMTQWTPTDPDAVAQQVHQQQGTPLARTRRLAQHAVGPLAWENEVTMTYGPMTELRTLRTDSHPAPQRPGPRRRHSRQRHRRRHHAHRHGRACRVAADDPARRHRHHHHSTDPRRAPPRAGERVASRRRCESCASATRRTVPASATPTTRTPSAGIGCAKRCAGTGAASRIPRGAATARCGSTRTSRAPTVPRCTTATPCTCSTPHRRPPCPSSPRPHPTPAWRDARPRTTRAPRGTWCGVGSRHVALVLAQGGEGAVDAGEHVGRDGPGGVMAGVSASVEVGVEQRERGAVGGVVEPAEQVRWRRAARRRARRGRVYRDLAGAAHRRGAGDPARARRRRGAGTPRTGAACSATTSGRPRAATCGRGCSAWLARRFGSVFVLALAQRAETRSAYEHDTDATPAMAADERIHEEVVRGLAARGRGAGLGHLPRGGVRRQRRPGQQPRARARGQRRRRRAEHGAAHRAGRAAGRRAVDGRRRVRVRPLAA